LKSPRVGNHCNYRGNFICSVNCCHRNACSVLCVGVGMLSTNIHLVMGDFTVATIFTEPLAGNGRLRRLCYSGFVGRNVDSLSCMNYVSYFSYHRPLLSTSHHQAAQLTQHGTGARLFRADRFSSINFHFTNSYIFINQRITDAMWSQYRQGRYRRTRRLT
jgi:hypothetical protein